MKQLRCSRLYLDRMLRSKLYARNHVHKPIRNSFGTVWRTEHFTVELGCWERPGSLRFQGQFFRLLELGTNLYKK